MIAMVLVFSSIGATGCNTLAEFSRNKYMEEQEKVMEEQKKADKLRKLNQKVAEDCSRAVWDDYKIQRGLCEDTYTNTINKILPIGKVRKGFTVGLDEKILGTTANEQKWRCVLHGTNKTIKSHNTCRRNTFGRADLWVDEIASITQNINTYRIWGMFLRKEITVFEREVLLN